MPVSHRRHGQNCLVLSCLCFLQVSWSDKRTCLQVKQQCRRTVWTELVTRQDNFVLSRPSFQFVIVQSKIYWGLLKTVLTCRQFSLYHRQRTRQDSLVLSVSAVWNKHKVMLSDCKTRSVRISHWKERVET